jgi:4-hydroxybenzoate polyprenyltransferase
MTKKLLIEFMRPFTLIAPALGFFSGGFTAMGAEPLTPFSYKLLYFILSGSLMAALLNAASNSLNQIYDLDIDRINKPKRPLPSGRMSIKEAWLVTIVLYLVSWILAWFIVPIKYHECFILVMIASALTYLYSVPPFRTKRLGIFANLTIAVPRGVLLKVAGWSSVKTVFGVEPWYIGCIFGLFLLGSASTKDFSDMKGDAAGNCITLPIKYGVKKAAYIISPFFVLPFALIPVGVHFGILTGNALCLYILGITLMIYGCYVNYLILRKPDALATEENHISWTHMYVMMFVAQIGFALSYLVKFF